MTHFLMDIELVNHNGLSLVYKKKYNFNDQPKMFVWFLQAYDEILPLSIVVWEQAFWLHDNF